MTDGRAWGWLTLLLLLALAACAFAIAHGTGGSLRPDWIAVTATLVALCVLAGYLVNGRADGILIDDRNRLSLARLQWVAWFVVLIGGYFTETIANVGVGAEVAFPTIPNELLGLLGIASASPVAGAVIVDAKKQPSAARDAQAATQPLAEGDDPDNQGAMDVNKTIADASWADLYLGEEVANRYVVDVSRLQNLVFTVLLVGVYASLLWASLAKVPAGGFAQMPAVGDGFLWLLGISHAAYLGAKATPKTPTS